MQLVKLTFLITVFCSNLQAHPCEKTKSSKSGQNSDIPFSELEKKMDKHLKKTIKQLDEVKVKVVEIIKLMERKQ